MYYDNDDDDDDNDKENGIVSFLWQSNLHILQILLRRIEKFTEKMQNY